MRAIADYVDAVPGCSKSEALRAAGQPTHGLGSWLPLKRTIAAGLIIADETNRWAKGNEHLLFRNERARQLFNLRQELLHGNPDPERAEQLVKQIEAVRAEQAATWLAGS